MSRIKKGRKSSGNNQKLKSDFIKGHLWKAADILSSLAPSEYRQPVMTALSLKRINDTFEEKAEKLISEDNSHKEAYENKNRQEEYLL
ncbi:MAG: type I restriction-modification system subunit M N-terminal domain-containing protein [Candidatus Nitrosopolaris sp.]